MSKENGELLHVFNEYLNKQEKSALMSNVLNREQLYENEYKLKMDNEQNQIQDNEKFLDFQMIEKEEDVEDKALMKKLVMIRPQKLTDAKRYKKMKNVLKSVKTESIAHGMMSIDDMMEWAMSTAVIDGASSDFMDIINAMKGINEIFEKFDAAWKELEEITEKQEKGEATEEEVAVAALKNKEATKDCQDRYYVLAKNAHKYVDNHDGLKWSEKGKNRLALANYILSGDFMDKYVVRLSKFQLKSVEYSNNLDADSFIIAYELQHNGIKLQNDIYNEVFNSENKVRDRFSGFTMESVHRLPSRVLYDQVKMLTSNQAMEEENDKVTSAMTAYTGKELAATVGENDEIDIISEAPVNKEPLYTIFDEFVEEVCNYKITEEHFTKSYYVKHPEEMIRLRRMSSMLGDCLDDKGDVALGNCGKEYLDLIKNSKGYTKFYTKLNFISHLWFVITEFMGSVGCFSVESILRDSSNVGSVITNNQFSGAPKESYDEEEYMEFAEVNARTPKQWMNEAMRMAKMDPHINEEMKKYLNSSIFSSIRVPKRAKKNGNRK